MTDSNIATSRNIGNIRLDSVFHRNRLKINHFQSFQALMKLDLPPLGLALALPLCLERRQLQREANVLRITRIRENSLRITLKLEGSLAAEWVPVLEAECVACLKGKRRVLLDFSDVTFVDENGVKLLRRLATEDVEIIDRSGLINGLLKGGKEK